MTPEENKILEAARIILETGAGIVGFPGSPDEVNLFTPEAVVAYDRVSMAKCDLAEILRRDEQELDNNLKASPAPGR